MLIEIALILAVIFQLAAFVITVSLIPKTRFNIAWISISIGFLLMALRRIDDVFHCFTEAGKVPVSQVSSWIAVFISISMMVAAVYIRQIFNLIDRIQAMRRLNERRWLSAVINTEEKERKQFSKELHDGLGPLLSATKMTLSAIDHQQLDADNNELLIRAESIIDKVIETTRELANHLTPHVLERYGLQKAIQAFIRTVSDGNKDTIKLFSNLDNKRLPSPIEVVMYRVCCELIHNTLKHAQAGSVDIILTYEPEYLEVKYQDDGKGMQMNVLNVKGMGLTNIKSRIRSVDGSISITSYPGQGFYAHIKIPLK